MGVFLKLDGVSWATAGIVAVIVGVGGGFVVGRWFEPRWRREDVQVAGGLAPDRLELARRAARGGPVPSDPEIRAAAFRILSRDLAILQRRPGTKGTVVFGVGMAVVAIAAAAGGSWWALLYGAVSGLMLYSGAYYTPRLRRRLELMPPPPDNPSA